MNNTQPSRNPTSVICQVLCLTAGLMMAWIYAPVSVHAESHYAPASSCQPVDHSDFRYSDRGEIINTSSSNSREFTCFVDNELVTGSYSTVASVRMFDNDASSNGWCRLFSKPFSSGYSWGSKAYTSGTGAQNISPGSVTVSGGNLVGFHCEVPGTGDSKIYGYQVAW